MSTIKTKDAAAAIFAANQAAVKTTTKQEVGGLLNDRAVDIVKKGLRGRALLAAPYIDTAIGKAVIANVLALAVVKWFPTNVRAVKASEAMVESAVRDIADTVNIRGIVDDFIQSLGEIEEFDIFTMDTPQTNDAKETDTPQTNDTAFQGG